MITMTGVCSECDDNKEKRLAKRRPPLCGYHYMIAQQKKSAEKNKDKPRKVQKPFKRTPLKRVPLSYVRKPTGELFMFNEIWDEREHKSFINDEPLHEFDVCNFAHVLAKAKGKFPLFKLYKKCVVLLTYDQHFQWDNGLRSELKLLPEWDKMFKLEEELKEEYLILKQQNGKYNRRNER